VSDCLRFHPPREEIGFQLLSNPRGDELQRPITYRLFQVILVSVAFIIAGSTVELEFQVPENLPAFREGFRVGGLRVQIWQV
jgi:hypothetical protein